MPSGSFKQSDVLCPFYKHDDGKRKIICEGITERSSVALVFCDKADYEKQIELFCCKHYKNCEIYRALIAKYEDD